MQVDDLQTAKDALQGHTIALCKDGEAVVSDKRGIAPVMDFIAEGRNFAGYSVADVVVGKAAAMLFIKTGVKRVYAKVLSSRAKEILEKFGIPFEYGTLAEKIINREGTDICPMEKTVWDVEDIEQGYTLLKAKLQALRANT